VHIGAFHACAKQGADFMVVLRRVPHAHLAVDGVVVAPSDAGGLHVSGLGQVGDDALRGALRDA
jgi:hypothetical protein